MKYILKVEVSNCYVVVVSFGRMVREARLHMCVLCEGVSVCCVLHKAVIASIPTALQQSDNPGKVNPRTAAAAVVSMHDDSTHNRHSTPVRHVGGDLMKQHAVFKGFHLEKKPLHDHGNISLLQVFVPHVLLHK